MGMFTGTAGADIITPTLVSPGVGGVGRPGAGADTLIGNAGDDTLDGGTGGDSLSGGLGNDLMLYQTTAAKDAGTFDGGAGNDILQVDGASPATAGWKMAFGPGKAGHGLVEGDRAGRSFSLDTTAVETVQLTGSALGDNFAIRDFATSGARSVIVDLGAAATGKPDGAADDITLTTTDGRDNVVAQILGGDLVFSFNSQTLRIHNLEAGDTVNLSSGDGDDNLDLARTQATGPTLHIDAGAGADTIRAANSIAFGGLGDDSFIWNRDGNDSIDGEAGADRQTLITAAAADQITLTASGDHVIEQVAGARIDAVNIETVTLRPLEGADTIRIGELDATAVRQINVDLTGANGAADGAADTLVLAGPTGGGGVNLTVTATGLDVVSTYVAGFSIVTSITDLDANDRITFQGTGGADFYTNGFSAAVAGALFDLGDGADFIEGAFARSTMLGGAGDDLIRLGSVGGGNLLDGGTGNDTVTSGAAGDILHGGDGNDIVESFGVGAQLFGEGGADTFTTLEVGQTVHGGDGDDFVQAFEADETVFGDGGQDFINLDALRSAAFGGDGNDTITTQDQFGAVTLHGDAGDDVFRYDVVFDEESGTVIDGGTGLDRLVLNSTSLRDGAGYAVVLRSNGGGSAHLFQNHFVNTVLDTTGVEVVQLTGGNGQDSFSLTDLTGSGVTFVSLDLGGGINDLVRDDVAISGAAGRDVIEVRDTNDGDLGILGLPATVVVTHIDAAAFTGGPHDNVFVRTGAGDDLIDMRNMNFDHAVIIDAGAGNDTILAGFGPALFVYSRTGNADTISGFRGVNGGGHDRMDVGAIGDHSFAEMIQHRHLFQQGANVIIDDTQGSFVVLQNVNLSSLSAADFLFA